MRVYAVDVCGVRKVIKKIRKTVVEKHCEYFYHPIEDSYQCKFCEYLSESLDSNHILKYHSEEMDLEQHMESHKAGKCKCSGSVLEL